MASTGFNYDYRRAKPDIRPRQGSGGVPNSTSVGRSPIFEIAALQTQQGCLAGRVRSINKRVKRETIQRVATPTAILVGLPEALARLCTETLGEDGLRVLKVGHVAAASERIPVVMPQLVLVSTALRPDDLDILNDRCVAVGARVIMVAPNEDPATLTAALKNAANDALIKALRGS